MSSPILRRYPQFRPSDFQTDFIWVCAYATDQHEPWYDEVDEVTYRPWLGDPLLGRSGVAMTYFVVRAIFELADRTRLHGFATPLSAGSLGTQRELSDAQPALFLPNGQSISFWTIEALLKREKERLYAALGKRPAEVFPIRYWFDTAVAAEPFVGVIGGLSAFGPDHRTVVTAS